MVPAGKNRWVLGVLCPAVGLPLHPVVALTDALLAAAVLDRAGAADVDRHGNLLHEENPDQAHGEELGVGGPRVHGGASSRPW